MSPKRVVLTPKGDVSWIKMEATERKKLTYQSNNVTEHLTDREDNVNQDPINSFIKNPMGGSRSPSTSCKIRELKKDNVNKLNAPL